MKIDVIIPFHEKDIDSFAWCVQGIKQNIDFSRIIAVTSKKNIRQVMGMGTDFIDEDLVVDGLSANTYSFKWWGWYYQQILKLAMAERVHTKYYLAVDSDTVFLKPVRFFTDSGQSLYCSGKEYHKPYFESFENILGFKAQREYSFITHHMIFNASIVQEMMGRFIKNGDLWFQPIINVAQAPTHAFSEYEMYGHYIKYMHPEELNLRNLEWANIAQHPSKKLFKRLAKYYDYCSTHEYLRKNISYKKRLQKKIDFEIKLFKKNLLQ